MKRHFLQKTASVASLPRPCLIIIRLWLASSRFESSHLSRCYSTHIECPFGNGSPERHATARGRATVPRPPHIAAFGVAGERTVPNVKLGERGAESVERSRPWSPIGWGIVKTWKKTWESQHDAVLLHNNVCIHELTYCCCTSLLRCWCTSWVLGCVGCCTCSFCCSAAAVVHWWYCYVVGHRPHVFLRYVQGFASMYTIR